MSMCMLAQQSYLCVGTDLSLFIFNLDKFVWWWALTYTYHDTFDWPFWPTIPLSITDYILLIITYVI